MDDDHGTYEQKQNLTVVYTALPLGMYRAVRLFCKRAAGKQKNFIVRVSSELLSLYIYIYIYIYIYTYLLHGAESFLRS